MLKSVVKQNNWSNKINRNVHELLLRQTFNGIIILPEIRKNFNFKQPSTFLFLDFHKYGLIKSCLYFEYVRTQNVMIPRFLMQVLLTLGV